MIEVDGETISLRGRYESVGQAIDAAGIKLREEDVTWPSTSSAPPESDNIVIITARAISLTLEGQTSTRWTQQENLASFLAEQDVELARSSTIHVDDREIGWPVNTTALAAEPLGQVIEITSQREIEIQDGAKLIPHHTAAPTVGQALIDVGLSLYASDTVEPSLSSWLGEVEHIKIERATPLTIRHDGRQFDARTSRQDVAEVLAEQGVGLIGRDTVSPQLGRQLDSVKQISIVRSKTTYELVESALPFSSQLLPLDTLEIDQRSLVSAGSPGSLGQLTRIETIGTEIISRTLMGEWISQPPVDEVVGYGTNIVVRTLDTPEGPIEYWRKVRMRVTAYTAADAGKPRSHPAYGITASGRPAGYGVVAIDPRVVPFRSQVYVPGYGVGFAGDTGGGIKGRWIDLGYNEGEIETWNGYVDVYYLTPVPDASRINYLIPSALP